MRPRLPEPASSKFLSPQPMLTTSKPCWPSMLTLYVTCTLLSMIWTLGDFNSVYLLTGGGPADLTHVLATLGIRYLRLDEVDMSMAAIVIALPAVLPLVYFMMKRLSK